MCFCSVAVRNLPLQANAIPLPIPHSLTQYAEISPFCLKLQIHLKHKLIMYIGEDHSFPLSWIFDLNEVWHHFNWVRKSVWNYQDCIRKQYPQSL